MAPPGSGPVIPFHFRVPVAADLRRFRIFFKLLFLKKESS
jgi:hypothetical protein